MALASSVQYDAFGIALITARKIETEARKVEPNLLRLVLLSNMYDKCASKVAEMSNHEDDSLLFPAEEDLTTANQSPPYYSANDDPSSSDDSDEWESDDSSSETEEAPPAYSLHISPQATVSMYEYCPSGDSADHSDSPFDQVVANFDAFNLHDAKNSSYYSTSSIRDFSESLIPPRTQPENLTSLGAPQVTKSAWGTLTVGRCWPVSSKEKSRISHLLHGFRAIVT
jgi:hypothetical protein